MLKLLGSIFEEVYGPLSPSDTDTVNGTALGIGRSAVDSTCTVSEVISVDVGNSAKQDNSPLPVCESTADNVTHSSVVTLQPAADVSDSSVHLSSISDVDAPSAAGNASVPAKHSEVLSAVVCQSSDTARDWSAGTLVADCSGKAVKVIVMLSYVCGFAFFTFNFTFPFLSLALPIFFFCPSHPFPLYQNSPTPFPGRRS